jgi:tetratricopeptide (TPR) repeat protein
VSSDGQTLAGVYRVDEQATTRAGEQGNFTLTLQAKLEDGDADAKLVAEKKLKMEMIEQRKAQGRGDPSQDDLVKLRSLGDMGMPDDKLARIEQELRAAVDDKLGRLGADHIDTLRTQQQLAVVMAQRGQQAEALALLEQTVAGAERVLGHEHPQTLSTRGQLAEQLLQLGRLDEALVTLQDVIAIQQRTLPDDNLDALLNKARLGEAMEKRGDLSQAETLIRQVMDTLRKTRGDGDPETQRAMSALEALLRKLGRSDEADQLGQARRKKGKGGPF